MVFVRCDTRLIKPLFLLFSGVILACEPSVKQEIPPPILATVNQDAITVEDFNMLLRGPAFLSESTERFQPPRELVQNLVNELIERHLLLQEAHRQQVNISNSEYEETLNWIKEDYTQQEFESLFKETEIHLGDWEEKLREDLLIKKILSLNIDQKIVIREENVKNYYETHIQDFMVPEQVKAKHIVAAKEEGAKKIHQMVLQGASFENLAKEKSLSPDAEQGGDLGLFTKGEMPEAFDVVFSLKESAISPIVKTPYGFHIFKVEKIFPSRTLGYREVRPQIQDIIFQKKKEALYKEWIKDLKSASSINLNLSVLQAKK